MRFTVKDCGTMSLQDGAYVNIPPLLGRLIRLIRLDLRWRGRLHSYMLMDGWDGMGWDLMDGYHWS